MVVVDLFCGIGGFSWGFDRIGMNVICGIDSWKPAINVYQEVHDRSFTIEDDIRNLNFVETLNNVDVDIIIGGPPCQAFSTVGMSKDRFLTKI